MDEEPTSDVPIDELALRQRETATENLAAADACLDALIAMQREHRKTCTNKTCASGSYSEALRDLSHNSALIVLYVAIERLV